MCKIIAEKGLGIGRVVERSTSMLGKWVWRFLSKGMLYGLRWWKVFLVLPSRGWDTWADSHASLRSPWKQFQDRISDCPISRSSDKDGASLRFGMTNGLEKGVLRMFCVGVLAVYTKGRMVVDLSSKMGQVLAWNLQFRRAAADATLSLFGSE